MLKLTRIVNCLSLIVGLQGITIKSPSVIENIAKNNYPSTVNDGVYTIQSPDGYPFHVINEACSGGKDLYELLEID